MAGRTDYAAKRMKKVSKKEKALLSGKGHPLLTMAKNMTKLTLDNDTDVSQAILEYVASNFSNLKTLEIALEYDDDAPPVSFNTVTFPKLEILSISSVTLPNLDLRQEKYPRLKSLRLDNIVGDIENFYLDLPTLTDFSAQFVNLEFDASVALAHSFNRCTNLRLFNSHKLWGAEYGQYQFYLPNCEAFIMSRSDNMRFFEIYAPKLTSLSLQSCFSCEHVRIVDEPFGRPVKCFRCGKEESPDVKLQKCVRCKITQYCSKECQLTDWSRHKAKCGKKITVNIIYANLGEESLKHLRSHPRVKEIYDDPEDDSDY